MKSTNAKNNTSRNRKWLRRILITFVVIIILPITLFTIGWLNRDTVIDVLQDWYQENTTGTLTIGEVNTRFLSEFPKVGFILKDIKHTSNDTIVDQFSTLKIDEAILVIGAGNLLSGTIKFEKIHIKNAEFTSEVISTKSLAYHEQIKRSKQKTKRKKFQLPEWLNDDGASFLLDNVTYVTKDSILKKYFNLHIHKIKGAFKGINGKLNGSASIDITVNNLGFNTTNGSFFNGARIIGKPKFTVDLENETEEIQEFSLQIDEQIFQVAAKFDLSDANEYEFNLQNPLTDFNAVEGLLPDNLALKLKRYEIQQPFKTSVNLFGNFAYGNNPDINITFSSIDNEVVIADKFRLKNTSFSGNLTNDLYETDSLKKAKKSRKDLKIVFDTIHANLEDMKIEVNNAFYQSTPEARNFIEANINFKGSNETLAKIIETDNFDFKGGSFQLQAFISGDIPKPNHFLNKATGHFNLQNTRVILKKNGLQLPIQTIDLSLERENSFLRQLTINLPNGENLVLKGTLKNISGVLSKDPTNPTTSQISLNSPSLNINEVISMAKEFTPKSDKKNEDRKNLHETLETIYDQFHPRFQINVDSLQYNDVIINSVKSNIALIDAETIQLQNFNFKYFEVLTNLKGNVKVYGPESRLKDAIYINAEASSTGSITVLNELFNIQLFRIDSGDFIFNGNVKGNVKELSEILNNAQGDLNLTNTKLYYDPAEMAIEIDSLALFVDHSDILLHEFNLEIGELFPMTLNGSIKQFPSFLMDNAIDHGSMSLKIAAPFVDGDKWLTTVKSLKNEDKIKELSKRKALHTVFKDLNKFRPEIELSIDSLKYTDLITENIQARIFFENDSILKLNNLDLQYKETVANIQGKVNSHISQQSLYYDNPFDFDFSAKIKGKAEDLNDYLNTVNFLFQSGDFEFKGNYKGQSEDLKILSSNAFGDLKIGGTIVDFKAAGLQIPVDSLHLEIDDDMATLKTLDIALPGKSSVFFNGAIDHFSDFINNSSDNNLHSSEFSIHSPYMDTSDIKAFLLANISKGEDKVEKALDLKKFKEALVVINTSFFPTISMKIDTLRHNTLNLTDFKLHLLFDNNGNFKIEDTGLDFYGGSMDMIVDVGIQNDNHIPVTIDMKANDINIHELVTRFDYFNDENLRQTDKIEGNLNCTLKAKGSLGNDGKLIMDSLNGMLQLTLENLELFNYKPIMENSLLMSDERFKNLRFQPIVQTFEIKDGLLIIPRTEIQSTAIQVFVEGSLKFNEYMDVWLSLPYNNLKKNEGLELPEKTTYEDSGAKFYIELVQDKTSERTKKQKLKVKVKLGNRKLRKQRERQN